MGGLAKSKLDVDDSVRERAKQLTAGAKTVREKVNAIYQFAASETRYVALEFGIEGIRPRRAALTLARGWGDCKDKAALIVSLLREVGVAAELVLVRTGMRGGFDMTTASLAPFDHAIAYVPELDLYLDGTAEHSGSAELPTMDRAAPALRISSGVGKLVTLPQPAAGASRTQWRMKLKLDSRKGTFRFDGRVEVQGAQAPSWRRRLHTTATRRDRVKSQLAGMLGPVTLAGGRRGLELSDLDAIEQPLVMQVRGSGSATKEGQAWSLPMGTAANMTVRFAMRARRHHPLLLGPRRLREQNFEVTVPAGMRVASAPKPMSLQSPFGRFELKVTQTKSVISVQTRLQLDRALPAPRGARPLCWGEEAPHNHDTQRHGPAHLGGG